MPRRLVLAVLALLALALGPLAPTGSAAADRSGGYTVSARQAGPFTSIAATGQRVDGSHCYTPGVCSRPITLPFPVTVFGRTTSHVFAQNEGTLLLREYDESAPQTALPDSGNVGELAPYLAGLEYVAPGDGVFVQAYGAAPHRRLVVEWDSHQTRDAAAPVVVQAVLTEGTSRVTYQYLHVDDALRPVVGAQSDSGESVVKFRGQVRDGLAVDVATDDTKVAQTVVRAPAEATYGQRIKVSAAVSRLGQGPVPTGDVTFLADGVEVGHAALSAKGVATVRVSTTTLGYGDLSARYSGDGATPAGLSETQRVTVRPAATTTTFVSPSDGAHVAYGTPYVVAVRSLQAGSGSPTGYVQWYTDNGYVASTQVLRSRATLPGSALPRGSYTLYADYPDQDHFTGSDASIHVTVE